MAYGWIMIFAQEPKDKGKKKKSRTIPGRHSDLVVVQTFARVIDKEIVAHKKETEDDFFHAGKIKGCKKNQISGKYHG